MNERIKELWTQGTQTGMPREGDYSSVSAKNIEKFAELIVRECAEFANHYQATSNYTDISKAIKQHFGVEE